MYFARTLRAAGLPVGPGKVLAATEAVRAVGIANRSDFYWALHAVFVNRRDQRDLFDQAFHIFWRNPQLLEKMMGLLLPEMRSPDAPKGEELSRRLAEALHPGRGETQGAEPPEKEIELDAAMTFSDREVLQKMDFEQMSAEEIERAKLLIKQMTLPLMDVPTRRFRADPRGARADMRATIRAALRSGGLLASTWASLVSMGRDGYTKYAKAIFETAFAMQDAVRSHPELRILGEPTFCFSFTSDEFDIYHVNDFMRTRGWRFNGQQYPNAIHMAVTRPQTQEGVSEAFAADLAEAIPYAVEHKDEKPMSAAIYGGIEGGMTDEADDFIRSVMTDMLDKHQGLPRD